MQHIANRWMVPMDFSSQAYLALDWVSKIMKSNDYLVVLNVLNLKSPTYVHDIANNERMKKESQEKLDEINKHYKELGFDNVEIICTRGEPKLNINTIVMGRRGMSNLERVLNGSVSSYVLTNAPCAVCLMGKKVEDAIANKEMDKEIHEDLSKAKDHKSQMPFFLPRSHSFKNYYSDSDYKCILKQTK